jgi:hypothetical protein
MKKSRVAFSFLCGTGFSCLFPVLASTSSAAFPYVLMGVFLLPGGVIAEVIAKPKEFSPTLLVLAANILIYTVIAYAGLSVFGRGLSIENLRVATIRLLLPVFILAGLACTSRFNPMWPQAMAQLTRQEKELRQALPVGIGVEATRAVLRSKGIEFSDNTETAQGIVFDDGKGHRIIAALGNRVLAARQHTEAWAFPCGYDIQLVLLFGQDEKLSQEYIERSRVCL